MTRAEAGALVVALLIEAGAAVPDVVDVYADPHVDDVFAVRITTAGTVTAEYLLHADRELEEVQFQGWPPAEWRRNP